MTIRVLLVDDDPLVRDALRAVLTAGTDIEVVGEAGDGQSAVELAATARPDVALVDVRMPGIDGITATHRLTTLPRWPVKVVVLTAFDADAHVFDAIAAGADAFLVKDAGAEEVLRAVRAVAAGHALLAPSVTRRVLDALTRPRQRGDLLTVLTPREREILVLLAEGFTNTEIADELSVGYETVKSHVSRLLAKLGARDRVHAVVMAHRAGITGRPGRHDSTR